MATQKIRRCAPLLTTFAAALIASGLLVGSLAAGAGASSAPNRAQAEKKLLVLSDMPKGWTKSKESSSSQPFPDPSTLAKCLGVPTRSVSYTAPSVNSPEFDSKDNAQSVNDSVSTYPSSKAARIDFAFYRSPKTPSCFTTYLNGPGRGLFTSGAPAGSSVGSILVSRAPASDFAPHTANLIVFIPEVIKGTTINLQLTLVDYVKGQEEQTVSLTSADSPFSASLSRHLTDLAVASL